MPPDLQDAVELQNLLGRFANSLDLKEWDRLGECLAESLYTDYSDLRGTPPEVMSRDKYVQLRRAALEELQTHHLFGNLETDVDKSTAHVRASMIIYRQSRNGDRFNTHCLYFLVVKRGDGGWRITSIRQTVLMSEGASGIHKGVGKRDLRG